MKKRGLVRLLLSVSLFAPLALGRVVQADEASQANVESKEILQTEAVAKPSEPVSSVQQPAVLEVESKESSVTARPEKQEEESVTTEKSVVDSEKPTSSLESPPLALAQDASLVPSAVPATAKGQDLSAYTGSLSNPALADKELTLQEAVDELLKWAAVNESQLGTSAQDRVNLAKSMGMIDKEADLTARVQGSNLQTMYAVAKRLHDAYRAEKKAPLFLNGRAQPIFPYSSGAKEDKDYSYEKSDIVRFPVYVETDHDTDGDGKRDLVKAIVQLPKAVAQGDFKASTILEARPYVAGTLDENYVTLESLNLPTNGSYDMKSLHNKPAKRQPVSSMSSIDAAKRAKASDWYYYSPYEGIHDYENLNWYDYFLVRGYAFVSSAGLGTKGSEGFNTTGSDLEVEAFKNIVEWVNGKRTAYTDRTSNIEIKADWANGKVGMTGLSWAGTTTFGVATTGVEGLRTIVPAAGIASWYDYFNSQGTAYSNPPYSDLSWLSLYVSTRMLDQDDWATIWNKYADYINQLNKDQKAHGRNYSQVWRERDYTLNSGKIKTSALLVHGLNDDNVKTKQFELMYDVLKKAGQNVKLYLHQGDHVHPAAISRGYGIKANNQDFYDLLNIWFSHYLYDVKNDVSKLPTVLAQNNYDPNKWTSYDNWKSNNRLILTAKSKRLEETISSDYAAAGIDTSKRDEAVSQASSKANMTFMTEVKEDTTIKGHIPVHFKAALAKGSGKNLQVNALLVDVSDQEFDVVGNGAASDDSKAGDFWMGSNLSNLDVKNFATTKTKYKVIAKGWLNLANPESGYTPSSSEKSIKPKVGQFHDYTMYLQPNLYTVKKGHKLALVFNTYDPSDLTIKRQYAVTFKTDSISALVPTVEASRSQKADYVASALDTEYANLPEILGEKLVAPEIREVPEYIFDRQEPQQGTPSVDSRVGRKEEQQGTTDNVQQLGSQKMVPQVQQLASQPEASQVEQAAVQQAQQAAASLPKTGSHSEKGMFYLGLVLLVSTFGMSGLVKKYSRR